MKEKNKKEDTLGASLLANLLTGQRGITKSQGRGINRAGKGKGINRAGERGFKSCLW